ncbi:MAG: luciferase family protein [Longimicrobiales bacterium]
MTQSRFNQSTFMPGVRRHSAWQIAAWLLLVAVPVACGDSTDPVPGDVVLCSPDPSGSAVFEPLPDRAPPAAVTTGTVPHRQIDPDIIPEVITELHERVFDQPLVESRESTIVTDATAIWIRAEVNLGRPECIVSGREVAHIHEDGSVHGVVPHGRIPDAESAGWIELHPFAGVQPGFEAYVLMFSPRSSEEVDVILDLILEGVAFVTEG